MGVPKGKWVKITLNAEVEVWLPEQDWPKLKDNSYLYQRVMDGRAGRKFTYKVEEKGETG